MNIDIRSLEKLRDSLSKSEKLINRVLIDICNEVAGRMFKATVKDTPVDTGWLRENWYIGPIKKVSGGYQVEIINPVEYAVYVEYGHRIVINGVTIGWQNGVFMLTIAEMEVKDRIDKIIERRIDKILKDTFR